jgi:hypothetical protein
MNDMTTTQRLAVDVRQIGQFIGALFPYASDDTFVSLRAFYSDHATAFIRPSLAARDILLAAAIKAAQEAADDPRPAVFCPPVCTFKVMTSARGSDLADGLSLSIEIDQGNTVKVRQKLEHLLGPCTVVVKSGGEWTDPETGEVFPKLHLHWRLSEPTRCAEDHGRLRHARDMASALGGGDPTGVAIVHPLRWPGSWHRKAAPRLTTIMDINSANQIHLEDALDRLTDAIEQEGMASVTRPVSGDPEADVFHVTSALMAIPNGGECQPYETWIKVAYATCRAVGSAGGFPLFEEWSAKSDKFDANETSAVWARIQATASGKGAGAGTLFYMAKAAGWTDPRKRGGPPPPASPTDYGKVTSKPRKARVILDVAPVSMPAVNADDAAKSPLPVIQVTAGQLHTMATQGERALCDPRMQVFQRGKLLVQPVTIAVPASDDRTTTSAGLSELTLPATIDRLSQAAEWVKWNARAKELRPTDPPPMVASIILARAGKWTVPSIAGVVTTPTLRADGSVLCKPGYDAATRLFYVADPDLIVPPVMDKPSEDDAGAALKLLKGLLVNFPLVTEVDRAVALSGMITPVVRGCMSVAPMHGIKASAAASGKSYLADTISHIANGRPCPVIAAAGGGGGANDAETEKRLVGLLLAGVPLINIDNVNGPLGSDLLCQAIERPIVQVRPLGGSEMVEIESRSSFMCNGNGISITSDTVRRTVIAELDANMERPELRTFDFSPCARILADRGAYIMACITIVRAYMRAGKPGALPQLASFGQWSDLVRSALVWLGCADPCDSMESVRKEDPELSELRELLGAWISDVGLGTFTAREVASLATDILPPPNPNRDLQRPVLHDILLRIAGHRNEINARRFGEWLGRYKGRIATIYSGGDDRPRSLRLTQSEKPNRDGVALWSVIVK